MGVTGQRWSFGLGGRKMARIDASICLVVHSKNFGTKHSGMALIAVLWITAALSLLAMSLSQMARTDVQVVGIVKQSAEAQARADGALTVAVDLLAKNLVQSNGYQQIPVVVGGEKLTVTAVSSVGFINVNAASVGLLRDMFIYGAGLSEANATRLADNIVAWRSPPSAQVDTEQEAALYRQAGLSPPRHAPFIMPQDLRQVLGITPDIYARISPLISTSNKIKSSLVDPLVAPPDVLLVLAKGNDGVVRQIIQSRGQKNAAATIFNPAQYPGLTPQYIGNSGSFIFRLAVPVPKGNGYFWQRTWWVDFSATSIGGAPWGVTLKEPLRATRNGVES